MTNQVSNAGPAKTSGSSGKLVAIVAIIAVTVIILACNATAIVYFSNVNW